MARRARERLLESARDLFAADGIRAVSVEQLLERSGVGRASFYRHFATKDELVVAVLSCYNERWHAMLRTALDEGAGVLAVFDMLAVRLSEPDYRGCGGPCHRRGPPGQHEGRAYRRLTDAPSCAGGAGGCVGTRRLVDGRHPSTSGPAPTRPPDEQ